MYPAVRAKPQRALLVLWARTDPSSGLTIINLSYSGEAHGLRQRFSRAGASLEPYVLKPLSGARWILICPTKKYSSCRDSE